MAALQEAFSNVDKIQKDWEARDERLKKIKTALENETSATQQQKDKNA